jgi:hypothetical protein
MVVVARWQTAREPQIWVEPAALRRRVRDNDLQFSTRHYGCWIAAIEGDALSLRVPSLLRLLIPSLMHPGAGWAVILATTFDW